MAHIAPEAMDTRATQLLSVFDTGGQCPPLSMSAPLGTDTAYEISAQIHAARSARGEKVVGRKIGFTNQTIWDQYGVDAPMWSWMYDTTVSDLPADGVVKLPTLAEPRLEPEIAFGFLASPAPGMDIQQIAECIEWVAHGFEIVTSPFPGWRFTIQDCIAAQALHGRYWCGERRQLSDVLKNGPQTLEDFSVTLTGPNEVRVGHATDVLGGPLHAMKFLLDEIARMPGAPSIQPGEIVTTGTLTDGHPVTVGETWSTEFSGIDLAGRTITFHGA